MAETANGRYDGVSHQDLYNQLMAGNPQQITDNATAWNTAHTSANAIADAFARTLRQVGTAWPSAAGAEYVRRVSAIGSYARELAVSYQDTSTGLKVMSSTLRAAQTEGAKDNPENTDDHDRALLGALDGAAKGSFAGPGGTLVGGIVGAFNGHSQDEAEKKAAHDRIVAVVEGVANSYLQTRSSTFLQIPEPPIEMPYTAISQTGGNQFGPGANSPSLLYRPHSMGNDQTGTVGAPGQVSGGPQFGPGANDPSLTDGTVLPVSDSPDSGLAGAGGGLGLGNTGPVSGLGNLGTGTGTGLTSGQVGGGLPFGGGPGNPGRTVDGRSASGVGRGAGGTRAASAPRGGTGGRGQTAPGRPAMGQQRPGTGAAAARGGAQPTNPGTRQSSTRPGSGGRPAGAAGSRGAQHESDVDEYDTWLTEDQLVWGDDADVPPGVLGETPPSEPREGEQQSR